MAPDAFARRLVEDTAAINAALARALDRHDNDYEQLWDAVRYSALAPGKRIRPFLTLSCCRALGGTTEAAMPYALAVECLHVSSLIHDDLPCMDDDILRRGQPTCHVKFGEATALLAGDALMLLAFELAAQAPLPPEATLDALRTMTAYAGIDGMMGGQMMDLQSDSGAPLSLDSLRKLQALKTGRLLMLAAHLGCLAAHKHPNRDNACFNAMAHYARDVGLAFQIIDDILDATGTSTELGKSTGQDAKHNKSTFVTTLGLEGARAEAQTLARSATLAVQGIDHDGTLTQLAEALLTRRT